MLKFTLRNKILITFLGTLLVGTIIIVGVNSALINNFSRDSADLTFNELRDEELAGLDRLAEDRSLLVEEYLSAVITDLDVMFNFAEQVFQGDISAEPRQSYWADPAIDTSNPPGTNWVDDHYGAGTANWDYSTIFMPGIQNTQDYNDLSVDDQVLINTSSILDYVFQSVHQSNPEYIWIYAGFENDLYRQMPYNDMSWAKDDSSTPVVDETYLITEERWYQETVQVDGLNVFLDEDPDFEILYVTAAKPIKDTSGNLIGVIGVDLPIDLLIESISGDQILEQGYAYMVDDSNNALMHPGLVDDPSLFGDSITELEFNDADEANAFSGFLTEMQGQEEGRQEFIKNGERWYVSYSRVLDGAFYLLVVVPEADILASANAIRESIIDTLTRQIINFILIMVLITAVIAGITTIASREIVKPIKELTEVTDLISQGNLSKDLSSQYRSSVEIDLLYNSFKGLITTLRFGNQDYYAGDLNRAMKNYNNALELFQSLNNQTGVGICYNNIGNIHRARGNLKDANTYYRKAAEIGQDLLKTAVDEDKKQHIIALSSRYNNLGLLYQEIEEYDKAEEYIREAMTYDKMIDNARGFATRYGNLGLIFLSKGDHKSAKEAFEEADSIAESIGSTRAKAYSIMNWGNYYRSTGDIDKAIENFLQATEMATDLDIRVVTTSLKNLQEIYEERGETELSDEIVEKLNSVSSATKSKEVTFVLDYSGSMAGKRIKAAVNGMRNIFKNQINDGDKVSVITFHSNSNVIIPPKLKGENIKEFMLSFDRLMRPNGGTAMYDALGEAFNDFLKRPTSDTQWIICLTDGDDNSSNSYNANRVRKMAIESIGVNLVIIGVGRLTDQKRLERICNATDRGKFIHVSQGVEDAITQAFEEVSSILSEVEVEGFVPDF